MKNITPLNDNVLVKHVKKADADGMRKNEGGNLWIPGTVDVAENEVEVVAVGPGKLLPSGVRVPPPFQKGDVVIVREHEAVYANIDGVAHGLVKGDNIIAVVVEQ